MFDQLGTTFKGALKGGSGSRATIADTQAVRSTTRQTDTVQGGGRLGNKPRDEAESWIWAEDAYDAIRRSDSDIGDIATTLKDVELPNGRKIDANEVAEIKDHLFYAEHPLRGYENPGAHVMSRYDAEPNQAEAWGRLADGVPQESDLYLILHELTEMEYYKANPGAPYDIAHEAANTVANWWARLTGGG